MTIVRELVTKLGFSFDRTNLDKFERSIFGFKTKATIAVAAIGVAFKKVIDYAQEFSNKVLNTKALATFSKTTTQQLDALQNVFKKFDVPTDTFQGFYQNLTLGIKEASRGVDNEFRRLVTQSQGAVRLFVNGQLTTSKQAIDDIMAYIRSIADESEKIRIVENIFGVGASTAQAIVSLSNLTKAEFDELIVKESQSLELLKQQEKAAVEFKQQINQLNTEWSKFAGNVAAFAVPKITTALGNINHFTETFQEQGAGAGFSEIGAHVKDAFLSLFGQDQLSVLKRELEADDLDFRRRLEEYKTQQVNNQASVTNQNKFEFNVAPGTTEQQATAISESVRTTLNSFWDEKVREVINNNPQVE